MSSEAVPRALSIQITRSSLPGVRAGATGLLKLLTGGVFGVIVGVASANLGVWTRTALVAVTVAYFVYSYARTVSKCTWSGDQLELELPFGVRRYSADKITFLDVRRDRSYSGCTLVIGLEGAWWKRRFDLPTRPEQRDRLIADFLPPIRDHLAARATSRRPTV
jgi:hypothetical protein